MESGRSGALNFRGASWAKDLRAADLVAACALVLLLLLALSYLTVPLTYDEAFYLTTARQVAETGLPLRHSHADLNARDLFQNSPPLLLYLMAPAQWWTPNQEVLSRCLFIVLFVGPGAIAAWWIARRAFGPRSGAVAALGLLASGPYVGATAHVQLDLPLGTLALMALATFHRSFADGRFRWLWASFAGLLTLLAGWTKYQAICISVAIGAYALIRLMSRTSREPALLRSLLVQLGAGVLVLVTLFAFFTLASDASTRNETLSFNVSRMSPAGGGPIATARAVLAVATSTAVTIGPVLLLAAAVGVVVQHRQRSLVLLLGTYAAANLAFNLVFFRLPGSGTYYLPSVVPCLAVLAGAAAGSLEALGRRQRLGLVAAGVVIQFISVPPAVFLPPYSDSAKTVAAYIERAAGPDDTILAETFALEFYTRRRVRIITFADPEIVLDDLEGRNGRLASFIVVPSAHPPAGIAPIQAEWDRLVAEHFVPAPVVAGEYKVYVRRDRTSRPGR